MWRSHESEALQPVLVLSGKGGLEKLGELCKNMDNAAGCAAVELPELEPSPEWMEKQADLVVKYINVLGCPWVHVMGHSVGALLGAYLAWRHPDRVGSLALIDTPIIGVQDRSIHALEERLQQSERDVNITDEEVAEMTAKLQKEREVPLPKPPLEADTELYHGLLKGGHWLSFAQLQEIRQPLVMARPNKNGCVTNELLKATTSALAVKDIYNIDADGHEKMLQSAYDDLAFELDTFHAQYLTQTHVEQMWEEVKNNRIDAANKMGKAESQGASKGDSKADKKKKKKGKQ
eukprot:TRINITY_DN47618_c0_g1_i1.p1 TRINITY_DN47618_c0_g1~~TRINITY_DN47618_c0_g1_i1.p1  ORF type:complete len:338 (+),score=103.32 TRINITY_DN47618_c0_g1_i1:142-1014(+)